MRQQVDSIIDHRELAPECMADLSILQKEVIHSLSLLTHSERVVLQLRLGLGPYDGVSYTLEESGRVLNWVLREMKCAA